MEKRVTGQSDFWRSREAKTTSLCRWDNGDRTSPQVEKPYYGSIDGTTDLDEHVTSSQHLRGCTYQMMPYVIVYYQHFSKDRL